MIIDAKYCSNMSFFGKKNMLLVEINLRKEIASAGFLAFSHQTSSGRCKASDP